MSVIYPDGQGRHPPIISGHHGGVLVEYFGFCERG